MKAHRRTGGYIYRMMLTDDQILEICAMYLDGYQLDAVKMVRNLTGITDIVLAVAYTKNLVKEHFPDCL